jgi:hypothetical protein
VGPRRRGSSPPPGAPRSARARRRRGRRPASAAARAPRTASSPRRPSALTPGQSSAPTPGRPKRGGPCQRAGATSWSSSSPATRQRGRDPLSPSRFESLLRPSGVRSWGRGRVRGGRTAERRRNKLLGGGIEMCGC